MASTQSGNMKDMMQDVVFHVINGWMSHVVTHTAHTVATGLAARMKLIFMKTWISVVPCSGRTGAGLITSIRRMAEKGMKGLEMHNINSNTTNNINTACKETRALFTDNAVRIYQAFPVEIAEEAIMLGKFGPHFKMERMSWIKPSFLWMMYRCGWAMKPGQERVLAVDIKRTAFDYAINNAVASTFSKSGLKDYKEWQQQIKQSDIRCQWDPERDIYGNPLDYRSLQIGLRRGALKLYVEDWILKIEDITEYVKMLAKEKEKRADIQEKLPAEKMYQIKTGTFSLR